MEYNFLLEVYSCLYFVLKCLIYFLYKFISIYSYLMAFTLQKYLYLHFCGYKISIYFHSIMMVEISYSIFYSSFDLMFSKHHFWSKTLFCQKLDSCSLSILYYHHASKCLKQQRKVSLTEYLMNNSL